MLERLREFGENAPDWVGRFICGFLVGLVVIAGIILAFAPLALAIIFETWNWFWAYAIIIPVFAGVFAAFDL